MPAMIRQNKKTKKSSKKTKKTIGGSAQSSKASKRTARSATPQKKKSSSRKAKVGQFSKKSINARIRKVVQIDALDQVLLNMTAKPYDKILKQIEVGKKRLDEERRLALQLGIRILNKAKKVRDSLIHSAKRS